jgi:hypothetical protein
MDRSNSLIFFIQNSLRCSHNKFFVWFSILTEIKLSITLSGVLENCEILNFFVTPTIDFGESKQHRTRKLLYFFEINVNLNVISTIKYEWFIKQPPFVESIHF